MAHKEETARSSFALGGLITGPLVALAVYLLLPTEYRAADEAVSVVVFDSAGRVTLALLVWMAIWWMTEAVELATTALLPIVVLPALGAMSATEAAAPYAHRLIFLYIGGFIIALSMQRWGLDRRIALNVLRLVGCTPVRMVGGFMIATAVLSAFISNTATTAMMLPIALSVVALVREREETASAFPRRFAVCLLLGIAYSASIGGVSTLIGTPPNTFLSGFWNEHQAFSEGREITFASWLPYGLPVTLVMLPCTWWLLSHRLFRVADDSIEGGYDLVQSELEKLGPLGAGERVTLWVFGLTAVGWMTRPIWGSLSFQLGERTVSPFVGISDPVIAMGAAIALFVIPLGRSSGKTAMNWETAAKLPWDIILLFGGGMSLAAAVKANGVAEFIGSQAYRFEGIPLILMILVVVTAVVFLTELTSNLATTATLLPVLAALAPGLGMPPLVLIIPATLAASCAFMLPVATPPNAIVFGSREIRLSEMNRAGLWLNGLSILVITFLGYLIAR